MTAQTFSPALTRSSSSASSRLGLRDLFALWQQRRSLARLDDRMLSDIGVTPEEAAREINRPIWDAPATWLR